MITEKETFEESLIVTIEAVFAREKEIEPFAVAVDSDDKKHFIKFDLGDGPQKDIIFNALSSYCKDKSINKIAIVTEAWVRKVSKEEYEKNSELHRAIPPSQSPDRIEIVLLSIETIYSQSLYIWDIIRDGDNIHIVRTDSFPMSGSADGRLTGLLSKAKPSDN